MLEINWILALEEDFPGTYDIIPKSMRRRSSTLISGTKS